MIRRQATITVKFLRSEQTGKTICQLIVIPLLGTLTQRFEGYAKLDPRDKDQPEIGELVALTRALEGLSLQLTSQLVPFILAAFAEHVAKRSEIGSGLPYDTTSTIARHGDGNNKIGFTPEAVITIKSPGKRESIADLFRKMEEQAIRGSAHTLPAGILSDQQAKGRLSRPSPFLHPHHLFSPLPYFSEEIAGERKYFEPRAPQPPPRTVKIVVVGGAASVRWVSKNLKMLLLNSQDLPSRSAIDSANYEVIGITGEYTETSGRKFAKDVREAQHVFVGGSFPVVVRRYQISAGLPNPLGDALEAYKGPMSLLMPGPDNNTISVPLDRARGYQAEKSA